jgi:valyl-tRNA synthetase
MSKSKGNVLDPLDIIDGIDLESLVAKRTSGLMQPQLAQRIEKATRKEFPEGIAAYGADALRFTFAALATSGRDIRFDLGRVGGYRNFCNKLWNAARYVLMQCEGKDCGQDAAAPADLSLADRWIVSRLQNAEAEVCRHFDSYRFDLAAQAIYEFAWYEFCDWYLELSKPVLQHGSETQQRGTRRTLVRVLETLLRLAHPLMPFITEEIWQRVAPLAGKTGETIMLQPYPQADASKRDPQAEAEMTWLQGFILGIRQIRGEMDIAPGKPLPVLAMNASTEDRARTVRHRALIDFLARVQDIRFLADGESAPEAATALLGEMKLLVPMAGLIDKAAEIARLQKLIEGKRKVINGSEHRLANPQFVSNAPAAVVEKERATLAEHQRAVNELQAQLARIQSL